MKKAWRMVAPQYVDQAFDGEGARIYGGRWNSKGTSMVYTASSLSLTAMEILVHLDSDEILNRYVCIPIEFPSKLAPIQSADSSQKLEEQGRASIDKTDWRSMGAQAAIGTARSAKCSCF